MRAILSKVVTGSMIAGAALLVSACGDSTPADTSVDNTMVTDMNSMEPMDGTMTDNMTSVDGAMANDGMMANDMMANDMMANDTMTNAM
jgi:hypothetical protein